MTKYLNRTINNKNTPNGEIAIWGICISKIKYMPKNKYCHCRERLSIARGQYRLCFQNYLTNLNQMCIINIGNGEDHKRGLPQIKWLKHI